MSITGEAGGPPLRAGVSVADIGAGMWATIGILSALNERNKTGLGQYIDISLLDGQISWLSYVAAGFFASNELPRRYGSGHPTIVPYQVFETLDGEIMIAVGSDSMWQRFARVLRLGGEIAREFSKNESRVQSRENVVSIIEGKAKTRPQTPGSIS